MRLLITSSWMPFALGATRKLGERGRPDLAELTEEPQG
jgi:hypothetical protein